jgi:hypothetical protein
MNQPKKPLVSSRLIVGFLGCFGCTLLYILRSNLSVAIVAMVDKKELVDENEDIESPDLCYTEQHHNETEYDPGYRVSNSCKHFNSTLNTLHPEPDLKISKTYHLLKTISDYITYELQYKRLLKCFIRKNSIKILKIYVYFFRLKFFKIHRNLQPSNSVTISNCLYAKSASFCVNSFLKCIVLFEKSLEKRINY